MPVRAQQELIPGREFNVFKKIVGADFGRRRYGPTAIPAVAQDFKGVTVDILTRPGYVIAGPLAERGKDFEAMTGAKIVVTEVPFAEIFPKIQADWSTGTNSIDVAFSLPVGA